ncbi:MAG: beta-lactamase family protein [Actinomycetota bacterium]|nr:beta-lactamase family protein [Actinomycetota bacterium]
MNNLLPGDAVRFEALLARAQHDGKLPSTVAGLIHEGMLVWCGGAGEVAGEPADTQYRIGSITKTFTATLVLRARDDGLLSIDEPLSRYVPEAPFGDRTLRLLLAHISGLPGEPAGPWWERSDGGDFATLVAANASMVAASAEVADFRYSNLAYALLGQAVARVRGEDWWSLVRSRILEPLGMTRTSYQAKGPHAQGYSVSHLFGTLTPEPHTDTGAMAPAGQLWSTVNDLARYAGFVLGGHRDVLSLATLREAAVAQRPGSEYGLGFRAVEGGSGTLVGHTGTMPGFMASFFCDRGAGTAFIAFSNATIGQQSVALARSMLSTLAECRPAVVDPWRPTSEVPDEVRELVGVWHWGETAFEIRWDSDELAMVQLRSGEAHEEFHREGSGWIGTDGSRLDVVRREDGEVSYLDCETYLFTRTPYDPAAPIPGGPPG